MKHMTLPRFWRSYEQLPEEIRALADKNFELLKNDPRIHRCTSKRSDVRNSFGLYASAHATGRWAERSRKESSGFGSAHMLSTTRCWHH